MPSAVHGVDGMHALAVRQVLLEAKQQPMDREPYLLDGEHVHAVNLEPGTVVAAGVEGGGLGTAPLSGAHAVVVVLADEQRRQLPQRRDVQRLKELPLVCRAVAVPGDTNLSASRPIKRIPCTAPRCSAPRTAAPGSPRHVRI